LKVYEGKDEN